MNSRETILAAVRKNQPPAAALPELSLEPTNSADPVQTFIRSLGNIGGTGIDVHDWKQIDDQLHDRFFGVGPMDKYDTPIKE
jgi:hypothetical protein